MDDGQKDRNMNGQNDGCKDRQMDRQTEKIMSC